MATVYFTKPVTSDLRADVLSYIRDAVNSQARMFEGDTLVSPPVNAIRYLDANKRFEKWNGTVWNILDISGHVSPPGGSNTHIQFNDSGLLGGDADFTWDKTNNKLYVNGIVGIGAASPAWHSTYKTLTLGTMAAINGNDAGLALANNVYWDGTNWKYITTAPANTYFQYLGEHVWTSAASGTAGTNATMTQRMKLDVVGNMMLGASAPLAWNSSFTAFEIGKQGSAIWAANTGGANLWLTANAYYNGSSAWIYAETNKAWALNLGPGNDNFSIRRAASGTAGTALTWDTLVYMSPVGNLSLGMNGAQSSWHSSKRALEIAAVGHGFQVADGQVITVQNAYYDGAWKYGSTARAWMMDLGSSDSFAIYRAASGTGGTAITWGTHMVIDSTGTARFLKPSGGLTDYLNGNIEVRTSTGDAGIGFHNGGANASSLILGRSSAIFEFLSNPTSSHQQIKCHNVQTTSYIYGLNGNALNSYGGIGIRGEKNGYAGISFNRGDGTYMFTLMIDTGRGYFGVYDESRGVWPLYTSSFTSTTKAWVIEGNWYCTQNIVAYYSDERLKTKLGRITNAMDKVAQLEGFYYVQNDLGNELMGVNHKVQLALSAQDVQKVAPEVVQLAPFDAKFDSGSDVPYSKSGQDYMTVQYERLVPLLVEALKEANERIKRLEERYG